MLRVALVSGLGVVVLVGVVELRGRLGIAFDPETLRDFVRSMGVWAPLILVAVITFRLPLGLPSQVVLIAGGLCFGTAAGTLYGAIGIASSALAIFSTTRLLGRDKIADRLPARLRPMLEAAGSNAGAAFLAVGTAYPFGPISAYHGMAGVTGMSLTRFLVAVSSGAPVRALTYTYFGSSLFSGDATRLIAAAGLFAGVVLTPLLFPRPRSWIRQILRPDSAPTPRI